MAGRGRLTQFGLGLGAFALLACGSSTESQASSRRPEPASFEEQADDLVPEVPEQLDAAAEAWTSEDLHDLAKPVLDELVRRITARRPENFTGKLVTDDFVTSALRPTELVRLYEDGETAVYAAQVFGEQRHGADELPGSMKDLVDRLEREEVETKSKMFTVLLDDQEAGAFESDALIRLAGPTKRGPGGEPSELQIDMEWRVGFRTVGEDELRIRSIELTSYREIHAPRKLFADLTTPAFGSIPRFTEEFLIGTGDYHFRTDRMNGNAYTGSMGLAVGDVDGDGLDDVLVCQPGGLPNRLLVRRPDGGVEDRSSASHLDLLTKTQSALILDLDNDGDQDVALACKSGIVLAENDGTGTFSYPCRPLIAARDEITSLAAADYDGDGDLDLYACMYAKAGPLGTTPVPYHDAVNGPPNRLWRSEGGWRFTDVTEEVGLDDNNVKFSYAAIWEDFDEDGDLDLYVANDFGRNHLYRNEGGRFRDVAVEVGADDVAAGMGATVADFDLDGHMDLYVTNMFSSAGRRIVPQMRFMDGAHAELHGELLRHARGNSLLLNRGDGTFRDATEESGAVIAGWSWGSKAIDVNNDGLPDVYAPNGWLTNEKHHDL